MSDLPGLGNFKEWRRLYPTPATPEQLQNLATLYGLEFSYHNNNGGTFARFRRTSDPLSPRIIDYFAESPIERFIERLRQWRRRDV